MKSATIFLLLVGIVVATTAKADHISGGEMNYVLKGSSNGNNTYHVTLKIYMICHTIRQFNNPTQISVFNRGTNKRVSDFRVSLARIDDLNLTQPNKCITNPPEVCYRVGYYETDITLPENAEGYVISSQVVYRVAGIKNLTVDYDNIGATYTAIIPGTAVEGTGPKNSSARFTGNDLVVICAGNFFSYSFTAFDADNDELRYSFCEAYQGGDFGGFGGEVPPAQSPPYYSVPYGPRYNGSLPLGSKVSINSKTGVVSGIAPNEPGIYVVTACVEEVRNGKVIATQRKDLQVNVASCKIAAATLESGYMLCDTTTTLNVANISTSPLIHSQSWLVSDRNNNTLFTSAEQRLSYTFKDTGVYFVKLLINKGEECADTTTSSVFVYPGFSAGFSFSGECFSKPTQFTDKSTTVYGQVNLWNWSFNDINSSDDFSDQKSPTYTYLAPGKKNVSLVVGNTVGCLDTVTHTLDVIDKPPLRLAFRDTLICVNDSVQLSSSATGGFTWFPQTDMINGASPNPTVAPKTTTTYFVELNEDGCLNRDSVTVNVVDHVTLQAMNDTTICQADIIQLQVQSNGLKYAWIPPEQVEDPTAKLPNAATDQTTLYQVTASIGSCSATDKVLVKAVPYPTAKAGADTIICTSTAAQLHGDGEGSVFAWTPVENTINADHLDPLVAPAITTTYTLSVYDNKGCPKPATDAVVVTVLPPINITATHDTVVVTGQPLQLTASGGIAYQWSPAIALSDAQIANPVAVFNDASEGVRYRVVAYNEAACTDTAYLTVKVFKTQPSVFVPTAFTPNADGKNDRLKPIIAGMQKLEFFRVYNRWGQLVYANNSELGWDGTINGKVQNAGVYVWMVKAIDYTGAPYVQKGTVTLIR